MDTIVVSSPKLPQDPPRPTPIPNWSGTPLIKRKSSEGLKHSIIKNKKLYAVVEKEIVNPPYKPKQCIQLTLNETIFKLSNAIATAKEYNESPSMHLAKNGLDLYYDNTSGAFAADSISLVWDGKVHQDSIILLNRLLPYYQESYYYYGQRMETTSAYYIMRCKYDFSKIVKFALRKRIKTIYVKSTWDRAFTIKL